MKFRTAVGRLSKPFKAPSGSRSHPVKSNWREFHSYGLPLPAAGHADDACLGRSVRKRAEVPKAQEGRQGGSVHDYAAAGLQIRPRSTREIEHQVPPGRFHSWSEMSSSQLKYAMAALLKSTSIRSKVRTAKSTSV